jgi:hypothetical protein
MDTASIALLGRLIQMGTSSLLQYTGELVPFTPPHLQSTRDKVMWMAEEEKAEVARFTRYLQKQHVRMKPPASYPSHFTTMNFCSLDYLLPKLRAEHEKEVAEIETRLPSATNEDVRRMAQGYLDMKRLHLNALRDLTVSAAT